MTRRARRADAAVGDRRAVGREGHVEQDDLALDLLPADSVQFIEVIYNHDLAGHSIGRSRYASTERRDNDLLRCAWSHPRKLDQRSSFFTADPVRDGQRLKTNFQTEFSHLFGDILDGPLGLR